MDNFFTNPKASTLVGTYNASISSSATITLNSKTTYIEVTAVDKGIFLAWNRTVSSSDFDEYIGGTTTANFIQQAATGVLICIEK